MPDASTLVVAVPAGKNDTLVVGVSVTAQTVSTEGNPKKRLTDHKVGNRVWMKFECVSIGDIAHRIVIKQAKKPEKV